MNKYSKVFGDFHFEISIGNDNADVKRITIVNRLRGRAANCSDSSDRFYSEHKDVLTRLEKTISDVLE